MSDASKTRKQKGTGSPHNTQRGQQMTLDANPARGSPAWQKWMTFWYQRNQPAVDSVNPEQTRKSQNGHSGEERLLHSKNLWREWRNNTEDKVNHQ